MISKKNKALTAGILAAALSASAVVPAFSSAALDPADGTTYAEWFGALYDDVITNGQENGYLSQNDNGADSFGIPYHAVETVIVEAPDYGHETTSEAMSYIVWAAAMRDVLGAQSTNDLSATSDLGTAWNTLEAMIPGWSEAAKGSTNATVNYKSLWSQSRLKADTAPELDQAYMYPTTNQGGDAVNPLFNEFKSAYQNENGYYLMHWLADVDNWYGFGGSGTNFTFINTFQRGREESCFETVPHPSIEECIYGAGTNNGIKAIFNGSGNVAPQYAFTNAPDAEDRAIQAVYFANLYGVGDTTVSGLAGMMGDQLRNDMFDKFYKEIGCEDINAPSSDPSVSIKGQHFLRAWYTSWGGGLDGNWAWQIGCSHSHEFYQNPLAAYALLYDSDLKAGMKSTNAVSDYEESLKRQIEMYLWLQSAEGPIGGGCTNSYNGRYDDYPEGISRFYEMAYVAHPVYADPGSNHWIGNQVWAVQRLAELYYYVKTNGDASAADGITYGGLSLEEALKAILDRWVEWFINNIQYDYPDANGNIMPYAIPSTLNWAEPEAQTAKDNNGNEYVIAGDAVYNPDNQPATWTGEYDPHANDNYHCTIGGYGMSDVGCVSSLCNTLIYYAAANEVGAAAATNANGSTTAEKALYTANKLLSTQWQNGRDDIGLSFTETNGSLSRIFEQDVYIPTYYNSEMPDGSKLANGATFISIRESYYEDESFQALADYYDANGTTDGFELNYHRFWHAGDALMSYGAMALLYPEVEPILEEEDLLWGDANDNGEVTVADAVYILQKIADPSNPDFDRTERGEKQANCCDPEGSGVDSEDAAKIQLYKAELIPSLPV